MGHGYVDIVDIYQLCDERFGISSSVQDGCRNPWLMYCGDKVCSFTKGVVTAVLQFLTPTFRYLD